jgi:hypothetical protein
VNEYVPVTFSCVDNSISLEYRKKLGPTLLVLQGGKDGWFTVLTNEDVGHN